MPLVPPMGHCVDADRDRQNERVVLARRDFHAVRVPHPEPALRHRRDRFSVTLDLVLVVDEVALGAQLAAALDVDREAVATVSKRWFRVRDTYGVEIAPGEDDALVLAIAVCVDALSHRRD